LGVHSASSPTIGYLLRNDIPGAVRRNIQQSGFQKVHSLYSNKQPARIPFVFWCTGTRHQSSALLVYSAVTTAATAPSLPGRILEAIPQLMIQPVITPSSSSRTPTLRKPILMNFSIACV
jgi:hypothetical protein